MANDQAPVCHISQSETIDQPNAPAVPAIPSAYDLSSALAAIAALTQAVRNMSGQDAGDNNVGGKSGSPGKSGQPGKAGPPGKAGSAGGTGKAGKDGKPAPKNTRWQETGRTTTKVRVVSTQDSKVFLDVLRTTSITMTDNITGEIMVIRNN